MPSSSQPSPRSGEPRRYHHRTSFYAQRVKESLTSRVAMFLCSILLILLLVAGIIVFVLWLSLRPHRPRFYVSSLSFPALSAATPVSFNVTDRNSNAAIGIYYDATAATLFFNDRAFAAGPLVGPFYQPPKNTTALAGRLVAGALPPADPAWARLAADAAAGRAGLRLELTSVIQFKVRTWDTHRHSMHVSCDVAVGPDGGLLPQFRDSRCSIYFG